MEFFMRGSWPTIGFLFLFLFFSLAQDQPAPDMSPEPAGNPGHAEQTGPASRHRPTIGGALEGGGALGLPHIGVLQWFEDHHIPIDYLAGTSMGGLVGGLYASGKTPQQLHELGKGQNWG